MGFLDFIPIVGDLVDAYRDKRNRDDASYRFESNQLQQERFAKNAIQWRVQDAKAAGIHPLVALGASTTGYSPQFVQQNEKTNFGKMGQNVLKALDKRLIQSQLRKIDLENDILEKQLSMMGQSGPTGEFGGVKKNVTAKFVQPEGVKEHKRVGSTHGIHPFSIDAVDTYGKLWMLPDQKIQEGVSEGPDSWVYAYEKFKRKVKGLGARVLKKGTDGERARRELRAVRPVMDHPGLLVVYSPGVGNNWTVVWRKYPGDNRLFYEKGMKIFRGQYRKKYNAPYKMKGAH